MSPEGDRALWCAVIQQALDDAVNPHSDECAEARAFLTNGGEWFATVCQHAGLEPSSVQTSAVAMIERASVTAKPRSNYTGRAPRLIEHDGQRLSIADWCKRTGWSDVTLRARLASGQPIAQALAPKVKVVRRPKTIEHDGVTLTTREWADRLGIGVSTIMARMKAGCATETVLSTERQPNRTPIHVNKPARRLDHDGLSLTVTEWAERLGISAKAIRYRLRSGYSVSQALTSRDPARSRNGKPAKTLTHDGQTLTINQWADRLGLQAQIIRHRLKVNHPIASVLSRDPLPTGSRVTGCLAPGGGPRLSKASGDRRGELRTRADGIGDLHP